MPQENTTDRRRFLQEMIVMTSGLHLGSLKVQADDLVFCLYRKDGRDRKDRKGGRCLSGDSRIQEPPGSIVKTLDTLFLIENNLIDPDAKFECTGILNQKGRQYTCAKVHGHVNLTEALGHSCNLYFLHALRHVSSVALYDHFAKFLILPPRPIQIPEIEKPGLVLGYSPLLTISPPRLLRLAQNLSLKAQIPANQHLLAGMRLAARRGTGKAVDPSDRFRLALKTGTISHGRAFHSWMIGFAPFDNPQFCFSAFTRAGTSYEKLSPMVRDFLVRLYD